MHIILDSNIRLKQAPSIIKEELASKLTFPNPVYEEAVNAGRRTFGIQENLVHFMFLQDSSMIVPRGMHQYILDLADEIGEECSIEDRRAIHPYTYMEARGIEYRSYQTPAVTKLITESDEGVLISPAGSGKTIMGMSIIPMIGQPTLWLTHTGPLATQAIERAQQYIEGIGTIGFIGSGKWKIGDNLTIALIQTLVRNPEKVHAMRNDFGLVITDECHHCPARTFTEILSRLNPYYMYGLTATPDRRDGLQNIMYAYTGTSKAIIKREDVEAAGGVMRVIVNVRKIYGETVDGNDLQRILKQNIVENFKRNSLIVDDIVREAKQGHFSIVVSDRKAHCEKLHDMLSKRIDRVGIATGKYSKKHVDEQTEKFNSGDITTLVATTSLLGEGFDVPFLDRLFITMPFRAAAKTEQLIGRVQRTAKGKVDAVTYDYVDMNIGVLHNQFYRRFGACRYNIYKKLKATIVGYDV